MAREVAIVGPEKLEVQLPELSELRELDEEEIVQLYDRFAGKKTPSARFYLDELQRREQRERGNEIRGMTETIKWLTWAIFVLTVVNVVVSVASA